MPELPEVETIKRDLNKKILNQIISKIKIHNKKIIRNPIALFSKIIVNNSFSKISRRGKLLIFHLKHHNSFLLIHLKMTGQLIYKTKKTIIAGGHSSSKKPEPLPNRHTHATFIFENNSQLFFNDLRQFGYLQLATKNQLKTILKKYGIEPLTKNFTSDAFHKLFAHRKTSLKSILLNQQLIAGIGNIYADEICFATKINPKISANQLSEANICQLYNSIKKIIKKAIKYRGTTTNNYRDGNGKIGNYKNFLQVYGRENKKCPSCLKHQIKKIKLAGRGTHFCPFCQKIS